MQIIEKRKPYLAVYDFFFFFISKLHTHPMGLELMTLPSTKYELSESSLALFGSLWLDSLPLYLSISHNAISSLKSQKWVQITPPFKQQLT